MNRWKSENNDTAIPEQQIGRYPIPVPGLQPHAATAPEAAPPL